MDQRSAARAPLAASPNASDLSHRQHTEGAAPPLPPLAFVLGAALLAALTLLLFVEVASLAHPRATVVGLMDGTAWRPFVYRRLVPTSARVLLQLTPAGVEARLGEVLRRSGTWVALLQPFALRAPDYVSGCYCLLLMYASLLGQAFAFRALFVSLHGAGRRADLAAFWGVACAVPFFQYGYIYDFTTLLLSTLVWLCLVRQNWRAFALVYLIGCFNKETILLASLAFAITQHGRLGPRAFWGLLAYQLGTFGLIRLALLHGYAANPGQDLEWHLQDHWAALGWSWPVLSSTALIANLVRLVWMDWKRKPLVLRGILAGVLPPQVVLFLLFGYPFEWRVFYEILPVIVLLAGPARSQLAVIPQPVTPQPVTPQPVRGQPVLETRAGQAGAERTAPVPKPTDG
jgi:hypothetical protein